MPNIITAQDKVYYNITQVGTESTTGPTSTLLITPNEGYSIDATKFSGTSIEGLYNLSFVDTIGYGEPGNEVNAVVTWLATPAIVEATIYEIDITFDDSFENYSNSATELKFTVIASGSIDWLNSTLSVQNIDGVIPLAEINNVNNGNTVFNVEKTIFGYEQTNILCIETLTTPGTYYYLEEPEITVENSVGTWDFIYQDEVNDDYGNCWRKKHYLAYTADPDVEESDDIIITVHPSSKVKYFANFELDSVTYGPLAQEEKTLLINTNIPTNTWQLAFASGWANAGETAVSSNGNDDLGNPYYTLYIDLDALPDANPRNQTVTLSDQIYAINRDTITVNQAIAASINMFIKSSPPGEYVINDAPEDVVTTQSAKVIGRPNAIENAFEVNFNGVQSYYQVPYYGGENALTYELILDVSNSGGVVTAALLNNGDYFQFSQVPEFFPTDAIIPSDDYKNSSFIDFSGFLWQQVGGIDNDSTLRFRRYFHIRNQDAFNYQGTSIDPGVANSTNRTATLTMLHPFDNAISSTVTIEQDERRFDGDEVFFSTTSSTPSTSFTTTITGESALLDGLVTFVKINQDRDPGVTAWPQGTFNLYNQITTDDTQADTFKQYPRPTVLVQYSNVFYGELNRPDGVNQILYNDDTWVSVSGLAYNSDYNIAVADEIHQYTKTIIANTGNNSFSDRKVTLWGFHSYNEHAPAFSFNNNGKYFFIQEAANKLQAYIWPVDPDTYDTSQSAYILPEGQQRYINLDFNKPTNPAGDVTPVIGLWDVDTQTYTAMSAGLAGVVDGFYYTTPSATIITNVNGGYQMTLTAGFEENPAGDPERSKTLGFWHDSVTAGVDPPTDIISFFQPGAWVDPVVYNVTGVIFDGSSVQSSAAGSVTFNLTVSDYDATDFAFANNEQNFPVLELVALDAPNINGVVIEDTDNILPDGIPPYTIEVNPIFQLGQHTHQVVINYSENTTGAQFYFGLRMRHENNAQFDNNNTVFVTIQEGETMFFSDASWFQNDENFSSETYALNEENKTINVPAEVSNFTLSIATNLGGEASDENQPLYHLPPDYIVARWVSGNNKVHVNGSDENNTEMFINGINSFGQSYDIPHSFWVATGLNNVGLDEENSAHVIQSPTKSKSRWNHLNSSEGSYASDEDINTASFGAWPNQNHTVQIRVGKNKTGYPTEQYVAIWTGKRSPKTNLIDVSQDFTNNGNTQNPPLTGFNRITPRTNNTGLSPAMPGGSVDAFNDINTWLIETEGTDKIKWNYGAVSQPSNGSAAYNLWQDSAGAGEASRFGFISLGIMHPTGDNAFNAASVDNTYGQGKIVGISFDVEDYAANGDYQVPLTVGIVPYQYASWSAEQGAPGPLGGLSVNTLMQNELQIDSNGSCSGRVKLNNNSVHFIVRAGVRCTFSNIKVWEIDDETVLRPGSNLNYKVDLQTGIASDEREPNDIIKIIHAPSLPGLSFSQEYDGGALTSSIASPDSLVTSQNDLIAQISAETGGVYIIHFVGTDGTQPVLRIWDGANSFPLSNVYLNWATVSGVGENGAEENQAYFTLVEANNTQFTRTAQLGVWNGTPISDVTPPLDTFSIQQPPNIDPF